MCDKKIAYEETFLGKYFFPHTFFFFHKKHLSTTQLDTMVKKKKKLIENYLGLDTSRLILQTITAFRSSGNEFYYYIHV